MDFLRFSDGRKDRQMKPGERWPPPKRLAIVTWPVESFVEFVFASGSLNPDMLIDLDGEGADEEMAEVLEKIKELAAAGKGEIKITYYVRGEYSRLPDDHAEFLARGAKYDPAHAPAPVHP